MTDKRIVRTFLTGRISATLIIPIEIARKHGLTEPTNVVVEDRQNGIFITKLALKS
jgi:bifunctional DNA-binding transcriptional regulator/antitoxin component of YhaV-PrlF toxin-antitoxin module